MINPSPIFNIKDSYGFIKMNNSKMGVFFIYSKDVEDYYFIRDGIHMPYYYIHSCREVLAEREIQPGELIGFHVVGLKDKIELFCKFWAEIEILLNLPEKTEIYKTSFEDAIILKINSFWGSSRTRRQFFSLFLRAGAVFHKQGNTIKETLKAYPLSLDILPACSYFLAGNTVNPKDNEIGWSKTGIVETFKHYISLSTIKESGKLVKET